MNKKIEGLIKILLVFGVLMIGFFFVVSFVRAMSPNINHSPKLEMKSDFLQLQLEDSDILTERNFMGKFHFSIEIEEGYFETENTTDSKFVKNYFKENGGIVSISKNKNYHVFGDFDFTNTKNYEGSDYKKYEKPFESKIYFHENGYKLNVPNNAINSDGKIKEDYNFTFVITIRTVGMSNNNFFMKSGIIVEQDYEFKFNVLNNGIIKFNEVDSLKGIKNKIYFREYAFGEGKEIRPFKRPADYLKDLVDKIWKK